MVYNLVKKFRATRSVLDKKRTCVKRVLSEEMLNEIGHRLERSPTTSSRCVAQQVEVSQSSVIGGTKQLKLKPYKICVVQRLTDPDYHSRLRFCMWSQQTVYDGLLDPTLILYSDEAWFHLSGYVNTQNNHYWDSENPHRFHEQPLHDNTTAHTANVSMTAIQEVFGDRVQEDRDITYASFCSVLCIMEQVLFDEILILSVEENPHVYDKRRASYKDEKMKENTWLSIAAKNYEGKDYGNQEENDRKVVLDQLAERSLMTTMDPSSNPGDNSCVCDGLSQG
ncbi:hypothetical protein ANN_16956 [Periplaneta americana]|uniref:Uncharacterized protein n=1 Tax=Periplaneta americana TaxID=6978 RepID=A0ABQ8SRJ5_PERAM|nr:hypothetical protein ANN_16956 [Periplaneta americana]